MVQVTVSISNANSPSVQGLTTPLIATYHSHYSDRVRIYSASTMLTQMVTDGFSTAEAAYKCAEAMLAAPNTPAQVCIGRRANPPLQNVNLTCVDGTVSDSYNFSVTGSDGKQHFIAYTNVIALGGVIAGTGLSGTVTVTQGSTAVTFSAPQTLPAGAFLTFSTQPTTTYQVVAATTASTAAVLTAAYGGPTSASATTTQGGTTLVTANSTAVTFSQAQTLVKGTLLTFDSQRGVYYALAANVSSSTAGTLTTAYQGASAAAAYTTYLAPLAGTASPVNGSATVPTSTTQVGVVYPGDSVQFAQQLYAYYTILSLTGTGLTLTQPYSGTTPGGPGTTNLALVCQSATAASAIQTQLSALSHIGTPLVVVTPSPEPNAGALATVQVGRTDGFLNDFAGWAANGFSSQHLQDITADPGITADLTAMQKANNAAWYGFTLDSNSQLEVEAAAAWAEATGVGGKVFFTNSSDWQNTQTSVTNDVFSELQLDSYNRTWCVQSDQQLLCYAGGAMLSQALAMNPGSYTLAYKTLPGVPADSDTTLSEAQAMALNSMTAATPGPGAKAGNYYKTTAGQNWVFPGTCPSGRFMDLTIGIDWLQTRMQAAVLAVIAGLPKLPYTDFGIGQIGDAIQGVLRLGSTPTYGLILPDGQDPARPIKVTVPTAASLTSAQRASRNVPGVSFSAGLQGAIETTTVQGTLVP